MERLRVLAICGFGVGTSMLLKIKLQGVFDELGVEAEVSTADVSSAAATPGDVIFTSAELAENLAGRVAVPVIVIANFVDRNDILQKVRQYLGKE